MPYKVKTWFCGDDDLDEVFEAAREKVTEIVDKNVQAALDEALKDVSICNHILDTGKHSMPAGQWDVSFSDFETADGNVHTFRQSVDALVQDIIEDGKLDPIERSHWLFREAWARVFENAAQRIRAANGTVIPDNETGKYGKSHAKVNKAFRAAAFDSGLMAGVTPDPTTAAQEGET